jgi:hypothetical protein
LAYTKKTWATGDVITANALNNMENGIADASTRAMTPGPKGDPGAAGTKGADGKSITAITLTKDGSGAITGGTATLSDKSTIAITVTTAIV